MNPSESTEVSHGDVAICDEILKLRLKLGRVGTYLRCMPGDSMYPEFMLNLHDDLHRDVLSYSSDYALMCLLWGQVKERYVWDSCGLRPRGMSATEFWKNFGEHSIITGIGYYTIGRLFLDDELRVITEVKATDGPVPAELEQAFVIDVEAMSKKYPHLIVGSNDSDEEGYAFNPTDDLVRVENRITLASMQLDMSNPEFNGDFYVSSTSGSTLGIHPPLIVYFGEERTWGWGCIERDQ